MDIPDGWSNSKVGIALLIANNNRKPISAEERFKIPGQYPYYGPTKIQDWINEYGYEGRYAIIGEDGDHFLKYRTTKMTQIASGKFNVNNHAHVLSETSKCTIDWFYYYFQNHSIAAFLTRQGAKRYKLNKAALEIIPILLPPLPEQKKIAKILSVWDKAITTTEQLLTNSQQQKKALMQQLLTGKKRLPGFCAGMHLSGDGMDAEKPMGGEWKEYPIARMGKIVSGGTPDTNNQAYWNGDIYWMTPTDVTALKTRYIKDTARKITQEGVENSSASIIPSASLLVCTRATVGLMSISTTSITTYQGFKNLIPDKNFDVNFLYYLFSMQKKKFIRHSCGSTFLELSKKDFVRLSFHCPDIDEQQKIASVLSTADREIEALQQKLSCLKQEKKALMQQLLTGRRRVTVN